MNNQKSLKEDKVVIGFKLFKLWQKKLHINSKQRDEMANDI